MPNEVKAMTEEQVRHFLDYVDTEAKTLERSMEQRNSSGRLELAYNDKMELARLQQTKQMFLTILGK